MKIQFKKKKTEYAKRFTSFQNMKYLNNILVFGN